MCLFACAGMDPDQSLYPISRCIYPQSGCTDTLIKPHRRCLLPNHHISPTFHLCPLIPMSLPVPLITHPCSFCNNPTTLWCSNCHSEYYCCPDHLRFVRFPLKNILCAVCDTCNTDCRSILLSGLGKASPFMHTFRSLYPPTIGSLVDHHQICCYPVPLR